MVIPSVYMCHSVELGEDQCWVDPPGRRAACRPTPPHCWCPLFCLLMEQEQLGAVQQVHLLPVQGFQAKSH